MGRTDTLTRTHQTPPRSVFVFAMAQVDVIGPGSTLQRSIVFPTKEKIIMTFHLCDFEGHHKHKSSVIAAMQRKLSLLEQHLKFCKG